MIKGDVYLVDLLIPFGHKQGGLRPSIILSNVAKHSTEPALPRLLNYLENNPYESILFRLSFNSVEKHFRKEMKPD